MASTTQQKIKLLSVDDRAILRTAVMKKFDITDNAFTQRVQGVTPFSLEQRILIDSWLEETSNGRYQLRACENLLDLAGIPYPVAS